MSVDMVAVYRHDAHKFLGESHAHAAEAFAGVSVNEAVPYGADSDAAALSRPEGDPEATVETHTSPHRISLLSGTRVPDDEHPDIDDALRELLTETDAERAHERWLASAVAGWFNESVYFPYTSLKYHTLLVAALVDAYDAGVTVGDIALVVDPPEKVIPHRTIFSNDEFSLRLTPDPDTTPQSRLGDQPCRSWAKTWSNLSAHPLETDADKWAMTLDANLRRIRSWSTALQYLEEFQDWRNTA